VWRERRVNATAVLGSERQFYEKNRDMDENRSEHRNMKHDKTKMETAEKPKLCTGSWTTVANALYEKLRSYDRHVMIKRGARQDGTWYVYIMWNDCPKASIAYYPLAEASFARKTPDRALAAKSMVEDFCYEGPGRAKMHLDPAVKERQRKANYSVARLYEELDPKSPEDLAAKLGYAVREKKTKAEGETEKTKAEAEGKPGELPKVNVIFVDPKNALGDYPISYEKERGHFDSHAVDELRRIVEKAKAKVVLINPHTEAEAWKRYGKGPNEEDAAKLRELEEKLGIPGCVLGETPCMYKPKKYDNIGNTMRFSYDHVYTNPEIVKHCLDHFEEIFSASVDKFVVLDQVTYEYDDDRLFDRVVNSIVGLGHGIGDDFPHRDVGIGVAKAVRVLGADDHEEARIRTEDARQSFKRETRKLMEEWKKENPTTIDGIMQKMIEQALAAACTAERERRLKMYARGMGYC